MFTLHIGLGEGPSLVHPGRGQAWWTHADGSLTWWDGRRTFRQRGDRVTVERGPRPDPDFDDGRVWRDHELLFRRTGDAVRAIARMAPEDRHVVGPHGAVLIGEADRFTRCAPPRGDAQPLRAPLPYGPWGVRWSSDGRRVAGPDEHGDARVVELTTGADVGRIQRALPVDAEGGALYEDGRLLAVGIDRQGLREATCAIAGELLAGPGGVVWDLRTGRRCFESPVVPLGAVVPDDDSERWLVVPWDTGRGMWLQPRTGALTSGPTYDPDDLPETPVGARGGEGWSIDKRGLVVGDLRLDVPVTAGTCVAGRVWAWSDDGVLVAAPVV